jgi:hypothetical protein
VIEADRPIHYPASVAAPPMRFMEEVGDAVVTALHSSPAARGLHYVYGAQSVGKSALLRWLYDKLTDGRLHPVIVSAPVAAPDAAAAAAGRLAGGLHQAGFMQESDLAVFESPATPWLDKLDLFRAVLGDADTMTKVVLLIDEPRTWRSQLGGPFTEQSEQLSRLLLEEIRTPRVVTTGKAPEPGAGHTVHILQAGGDHRDWLSVAEHWGELADAAQAVSLVDDAALSGLTPMQVRFGVALSHLGREDFKEIFARAPRRTTVELCEALVRSISEQGGPLVSTLMHLRLVRGGFDDRLLESLGAPDAGTDAGKLLRSGLLYGGEARYVLHDSLRVALHHWLPPESREETHHAHQVYIKYYDHRREAAHQRHDVRERLSSEVELFWHACQAGVVDADQRYVHRFTVQPLLYGQLMAQEHGRPDVAERVFAEAAEVPENAYAVHHLAFARDRLAREPEKVEEGYRKALKLDDGSARWHARLINFLIDRGALADAKAAWLEALRAPLNSDESAESAIIQLHRPVLARLLRIGEVEFAEEVFGELDEEEIELDPALRALRLRLTALIEAERYGPVRPYRLLQPDWWRDEPRHLLRHLPEALSLSHWWAARVDEVDADGVELRFAEVSDGEARPGSTHVARELFSTAFGDVTLDDLRSGEFLEVGFYRNGTPDIAQVVVQRVRVEGTADDLPPSELSPQRYHAAAGRVDA